ncbi:MAG: YitT family protein [Lachnospiraceae bacterium]
MKKFTLKKACAVVLGNLILGTGAAALRISQMGNDPYTAANMAISDGLHMSLGTYQLIVNLVIFIVQLAIGRKYIGFGTVINLFFLGYIIEYAGKFMESIPIIPNNASLWMKLLFMIVALLLLSFGVAMYQTAELGVSPYDYLPFGMTDHLPIPYFFNRMITDGICVVVILVAVFSGFISWENSHLGIGTILGAFCLGPFINFFSKHIRKFLF